MCILTSSQTLEKVIVFLSFGWFVAVVLYIMYARLVPASTPASASDAFHSSAQTDPSHQQPAPSYAHLQPTDEL